MRTAVISDIHGNVWALDAVLADLERTGVDNVLNLGDCFFGPLDPRGTYQRLRTFGWPTVRGNQDRSLIDGTDNPTGRLTLHEIGGEGVAWLVENTSATVRVDNILACHGNLDHDDVTLIERIEATHVRSATDFELAEALAGAETGIELVLCGHSHQPGTVYLKDGRIVVNPGSVGLPAYRHDLPHPHGMEAGMPHARWAIIDRADDGWRIELRATPYDTAPPIAAASRNGRDDWATWIATGRAGDR